MTENVAKPKYFTDSMAVYTIYRSPKDHPNKWVVRQHNVPGGPRTSCFIGDSLDEARAAIPFGLIKLARVPGDDEDLFESWI